MSQNLGQMNYFGHAVVATRCARSPLFVLGAMLPDLAPMAGVTLPVEIEQPDLAEGLKFHLATDAVFHDTRAFIDLNRKALLALRDRGVSRGPARACAHMGVEMLFDAELVQVEAFYLGYAAALESVRAADQPLSSLPPDSARRIEQLCAHLSSRGPSVFESSKERFELRLGRTLAPRRRLAPTPEELSTIANYLCDFEEPKERTNELMGELEMLWK